MTRDTINQIYSSIEISGYIWLITSAAIKEFKDITVISPTLKAYIFLSISLKIHNPAKKKYKQDVSPTFNLPTSFKRIVKDIL